MWSTLWRVSVYRTNAFCVVPLWIDIDVANTTPDFLASQAYLKRSLKFLFFCDAHEFHVMLDNRSMAWKSRSIEHRGCRRLIGGTHRTALRWTQLSSLYIWICFLYRNKRMISVINEWCLTHSFPKYCLDLWIVRLINYLMIKVIDENCFFYSDEQTRHTYFFKKMGNLKWWPNTDYSGVNLFVSFASMIELKRASSCNLATGIICSASSHIDVFVNTLLVPSTNSKPWGFPIMKHI